MHLNARNIILFVVLSGAALYTWLVAGPGTTEAPVQTPAATAPSGYYLRNATLLGTDEQGRVNYRVFAAELEQASRDAALVLGQVRVEYDPQTGVRWRMTADEGFAPSDQSYLDLRHGVRLVNEPRSGDEPVTIETEALRLEPGTYTASTDGDVAMRQGKADFRAKGLKADLKQDYLEFESNVSARFPP